MWYSSAGRHQLFSHSASVTSAATWRQYFSTCFLCKMNFDVLQQQQPYTLGVSIPNLCRMSLIFSVGVGEWSHGLLQVTSQLLISKSHLLLCHFIETPTVGQTVPSVARGRWGWWRREEGSNVTVTASPFLSPLFRPGTELLLWASKH